MPRKSNGAGMLPGMEEMDEPRGTKQSSRDIDPGDLPRVRVKPAKQSSKEIGRAHV